MAMEREQACPECGTTTTYTRAASTLVNVGLKTKWRCSECGHTTVRIGDAVDTASV
jgi:ribosomal protein L37AE/L43A